MTESTVALIDPKLFFRRLDSFLAGLEPGRSQAETLRSFVSESFSFLQEGLRLKACLVYTERISGFRLEKTAGNPGGEVAEVLDQNLPALQLVFRHLVYIFPNPEADESPVAGGVFPPCPCASLFVGKKPKRSVLFFLLDSGWSQEELDFALNTVRAALGSRLIEERLRGSLKEAAEIQQSLLLDEPPAFQDFDIACRSIPTEEVGGDFFDFISFDDHLVGIAIGDASGHGIPAALQVRDVVTGLRMGIEKNLKIGYVFEKLNGVIHKSRLSSRFISVFYAEIEPGGNLIYVNAGHPPPLIFSRSGIKELDVGGSVIGPLPEARFQRGLAQMESGDVLVLCTDGILERSNVQGDFFGSEGVKKAVLTTKGATAQVILDRLFDSAYEFGGSRLWEDDATAVVVVRN
jgi:phosphoserine phosphatase RsbU/P